MTIYVESNAVFGALIMNKYIFNTKNSNVSDYQQ